MRSLLFVPADSPRKLDKSLDSNADVVILDLEDSVAASAKSAARDTLAAFLHRAVPIARRPLLFVRINALDSGLAEADLDAVMVQRPDGIVLPKSRNGADVMHLGAKLAVREAEQNLADGATSILAIATETAGSLFGLGSYAGATQRLIGLAWGAEDLSADLGAETNRTADGTYSDPYRMARTLTLAGAAHADVAAVDAVYVAYRDETGLRREAEAARRDGFTAKMAIHPAQVAIINAVFTPSAESLARARKIIASFAAAPDAGVIGLDGEMLDRPHLVRAQRIVARASD